MAQHDYVIANQSGAAFRADLNNALAAIVSQNSGAVEPSTTYAYQFWADTTAGVLKQRNAANNAWITLFQLDGEWSTIALENGTALAPSLYFKDSGTDTGVYSPGTDQVGIATGGVQRVNFNGSTEVVFNDGGADVDFRIEGDTEPNLFKVDAGTDTVSIADISYPSSDGSADQCLVTDGSGTLSFASRSRLALSTAVASTSGTAIDFTGIPSWVKRITVMFFDVSTNGTDYPLVRLGTSGGIAADANYFSMTGANTTSNTASAVNYTTGFGIQSGNASNTLQGQYTLVNVTGNTWIASGTFTGNTSGLSFASGRRTLSGALTQLRVTSTGGTDTFDGGTINILWEG